MAIDTFLTTGGTSGAGRAQAARFHAGGHPVAVAGPRRALLDAALNGGG